MSKKARAGAGARPKRSRPLSNMGPTLSGQTSIFGVVFFVSKSLEEIEKRKKL